jgi:raffinose/stachyose/melibiose transport system permease protein
MIIMTNNRFAFSRGYRIFLIPGLLMFMLFIVAPFVVNIGVSFTRWTGVGTPIGIGLDNYIKAFKDDAFWTSFSNNLSLILVLTVIPTAIGLFLAIIISDFVAKKFGKTVASLVRAGFYIPQIIPVVVAGLVWRWILQPEWGALNNFLKSVGLESLAHNWLGDKQTALASVMVMMIWFQIGYPLVVFMAGLQRLDPELYEAASIDGATWMRKLWHITLPLLQPELYVVVLTTTIYALKTFGPIFTMTRGGPGSATLVASYFSYKNFFEKSDVGYGATVATVLTILIMVLTIGYIRLQTLREQQEMV